MGVFVHGTRSNDEFNTRWVLPWTPPVTRPPHVTTVRLLCAENVGGRLALPGRHVPPLVQCSPYVRGQWSTAVSLQTYHVTYLAFCGRGVMPSPSPHGLAGSGSAPHPTYMEHYYPTVPNRYLRSAALYRTLFYGYLPRFSCCLLLCSILLHCDIGSCDRYC